VLESNFYFFRSISYHKAVGDPLYHSIATAFQLPITLAIQLA
jgi:hypothetical protein